MPSADARPLLRRCRAAASKSAKTFCFSLAHARAVPGLALLAAAAQLGDDPDAAALHPGERRRGVAGSMLMLKPP